MQPATAHESRSLFFRGSGLMDTVDMLTLASIGASIALFVSGKRDWGIFIGLWAPTFQALRKK